MIAQQNAAQAAVQAAALSKSAPRDVFDCIAAGVPRWQWEAALDSCEARAWQAWLQATSDGQTPLPTATSTDVRTTATAVVLDFLRFAECAYDWDNHSSDPALACMHSLTLAQRALEKLQNATLDDDLFESEWLCVTGVLALAARSFPDKESETAHWLQIAAQAMAPFSRATDLNGLADAVQEMVNNLHKDINAED